MRILIADADSIRAKELAEVCMSRGHLVERAAHGADALEVALQRLPDVVIAPIDLPVIDATRLAEILRGNPRTRLATFVFLIEDELAAPISMNPRDATVLAPWHHEDIVDHLETISERSERFGDMRKDTEIEGKLAQVSVVELLQLFEMNRKSGTLRLTQDNRIGMIPISRGQVADASVPLQDGNSVVGEKALYRLLMWKRGRFEFLPGEPREAMRIRKPMRALLLEGMRQRDEFEKRKSELPSDDTRLRVSADHGDIPIDAHPLTREVIDAVVAFRRVGDIVDHCSYPDYQVLRVLANLLARGGLNVEMQPSLGDSSSATPHVGLFSPAQVRRLREWVAGQRPRPSSIVKVMVIGPDLSVFPIFFEALRECTDFMADARAARDPTRLQGLTCLGHFSLGDALSLRVIGVPADPRYAPLWSLASHGILGAVALHHPPIQQGLDATRLLLEQLRGDGRPAVVHLLEAGEKRVEPNAEERSCLAELGGPAFVLPAAPSDQRLEVLRQAFSALVP